MILPGMAVGSGVAVGIGTLVGTTVGCTVGSAVGAGSAVDLTYSTISFKSFDSTSSAACVSRLHIMRVVSLLRKARDAMSRSSCMLSGISKYFRLLQFANE